ncbi:DUF2147 domain-containing protein [Bernardetia sp. ABR2-2B]|uniref:DUF2147 domain-containing protein n=1 Tax=Bernardetia sp. ABR2-2B TaxID=3127472 RepID=UPI0030D18046
MIRITKIFTLLFLIGLFSAFVPQDSPNAKVLGKWKTIDDETKVAKSIIEIYEVNGKVHGKISELLDGVSQDETCKECKGKRAGKKLVGMEIMYGLEKDGDNEWEDGKIYDPNNGKEYSCEIKLVSADKLEVRGYIGFSFVGRSQNWYRVK